MARAFADICFTDSVKNAQTLYGSREANQGFEHAEDARNDLTANVKPSLLLRVTVFIRQQYPKQVGPMYNIVAAWQAFCRYLMQILLVMPTFVAIDNM
jgi:hypothetical protein